jgi:hypothetical protein
MSAIIIPFPDGSARESRAARAAAHADDCLWDQDAGDWFEQASSVLDEIEALLDGGRAREVVMLCERGVVCVLDAAPEIDDTAAVTVLVDRLLALHLRSCCADGVDPVTLATFVYGVATTAVGLVTHAVDPYLPLLGDVGRAEMRRLLTADAVRASSASGVLRSILELRLRPVQAALARAGHPSAVG